MEKLRNPYTCVYVCIWITQVRHRSNYENRVVEETAVVSEWLYETAGHKI